MDYKNKYLKYKNKYLVLKNQTGGTFKTIINLVTSSFNKKKELIDLIDFDESKVVYNNTLIQKNEENSINDINDQAIRLYDHFNPFDFVALYDNIGALFICSKIIQECWNDLALEVGLNIAIFNGDTETCTRIPDENYIVGVNIISGCSTKTKVMELNTPKNNSDGKYFIGFDGYKHNYGESFYLCGERTLEMTVVEFQTSYRELSDELPIIKIIKIFFNKFNCTQINCRNCDNITLQKIKDKLNILKPKIDAKQKFTGRDNYFNSEYHIKCNHGECKPDLFFENYIRDILIKYKEKQVIIEQERTRERLQREQAKRDFEDNKNRIINDNPSDTDITKEYTKIMDVETITDIFGYNITLEDNYIKESSDNLCKIFLKKSETNTGYFNIIKYLEGKEITNFYIDRTTYVNLDSNGKIKEEEKEAYSDDD